MPKMLATTTCRWCGVEFSQKVTESQREFAARKFCSRRCSALSMPRVDVETRFWAKVDRHGPNDCWPWTASLTDGYGHFWGGYGCGHVRAHRFAYELLVGPVPSGLVLDHLCRNRCCVNPAHLEPVTERENIRRGESPTAVACRTNHCKRGHPITGADADVYITPFGTRRCRACERFRDASRVRQAA